MKKRRLLVTSALPYANGDIHIGHLVEHIQTDVFVRFQKLIGNDCYYMCADDAHGTAVMLSAKKRGLDPESFIQAVRQDHMADFKGFLIDYDHYYTTHSEENRVLSESFFEAAKKKGVIETKEIEQFYDESVGLFLADRFIKGTCPYCGADDQYGDACEQCYATYTPMDLKNPISVYSSTKPVLKTSLHYFYKLSSFEPSLKMWLDTNPVEKSVTNKLEEWFKEGLRDWDISRDAPYFGFKIPGTEDKYFYVWLDAPVGYIATTQSWSQGCGVDWKELWQSNDVEIHHFIGKDILYFHTLFWPVMLEVAGYSKPTKVHVHGFLTVNNQKMSKSRGTFILAKTYLKYLDPEFLRYYYASKLTATMDDMDFNESDFRLKINSDVLGKVINIGSRLASILHKKCDGSLVPLDPDGQAILAKIRDEKETIYDAYNTLSYAKAMRVIMNCADLANQYIDQRAPWVLAKTDTMVAASVCSVGLNALSILMIYLKPVCPSLAQRVELFLNSGERVWSDIDIDLPEQAIRPFEHLAKRLSPEDLDPLFKPEKSS